MSEEQTVGGAYVEAFTTRRLEGRSWGPGLLWDMLDIDPEMTVSRLREDLEIAARVRACEPTFGVASTDTKDFARGATFGWNAALAFLRGETA